LALDQSLIDTITNLRKISLGMGEGMIPNDLSGSSDYDGMLVIVGYLHRISVACGQGVVNESGIQDVMSALAVTAQYLGKIVRTVS
jgi:hypothetical protein